MKCIKLSGIIADDVARELRAQIKRDELRLRTLTDSRGKMRSLKQKLIRDMGKNRDVLSDLESGHLFKLCFEKGMASFPMPSFRSTGMSKGRSVRLV